MCNYCQGESPLKSVIMSFEVVYYQGKTPALLVNYCAPNTYSDVEDLVVPINYCPMCGRSLTKRAVDEGDSAPLQAESTPEVLSIEEADTTPALRN